MKLGKTNGVLLLTLIAFAILTLVVGSPVHADPPGDKYAANVFGTLVFAADGTAISMSGQIRFDLAPGKSASGGGTYRIGIPGACSHNLAPCFVNSECGGETCLGSDYAAGEWEATKLEGFHVEGQCSAHPGCSDSPPDGAGFPPSFTAGKGTFKIDMSDLGAARFIMWCRLPGIKLPQFSAFPESYRVDIGKLHFDSQNPAGNFFELCDSVTGECPISDIL